MEEADRLVSEDDEQVGTHVNVQADLPGSKRETAVRRYWEEKGLHLVRRLLKHLPPSFEPFKESNLKFAVKKCSESKQARRRRHCFHCGKVGSEHAVCGTDRKDRFFKSAEPKPPFNGVVVLGSAWQEKRRREDGGLAGPNFA